jgi:hypothetical protein
MKPLRVGITAAVTLVASMTPLVVSASPAGASDFADCAYPYVCLYKWDDQIGWHKTGQFQQFTRGWQQLTVSYGAQVLVNTRHDDVVYALHFGGAVGCFPPDNPRGGEIAPIIAIRIDPSPDCHF